MRRLTSSTFAFVAGIAAFVFGGLAHAQQTFSPKGVVQWGQGGDRERAMLTQMGFGQLTQGQFGLSVADLNGDNRPEILVIQMGACDTAGCPVAALQSAGQGKALQIFSQRIAGRVALTNERVNGYNAFASADPSGAIAKDAAGRALVYPIGAQGAVAAASAPAPAPPAAPRAAAPAAAAAPTAGARTEPSDRAKLATGIGNPDWRTAGADYLPACLYPKCLNMQAVERSGIGTAAAKIRGEVTADDAARWCALYKPADKLCAQTEIANYGTAGAAMGRPKTTTISANCAAGTLQGIDGAEVRYAGTWTDGPGAGRAKFSGGGGAAANFEQQGMAQLVSGATSIGELARDRSSGEALAIQWEMLCKGAAPPMVR